MGKTALWEHWVSLCSLVGVERPEGTHFPLEVMPELWVSSSVCQSPVTLRGEVGLQCPCSSSLPLANQSLCFWTPRFPLVMSPPLVKAWSNCTPKLQNDLTNMPISVVLEKWTGSKGWIIHPANILLSHATHEKWTWIMEKYINSNGRK